MCQNPLCFHTLHTLFHSTRPFDNFIILWDKTSKEECPMPYRHLDVSSQPLIIFYDENGLQNHI